MQSSRDTTVMITDASSGIGLATAHAFARRGANVILAVRRSGLLERAAGDCEELGGRALAVPTDVTDAARVRELAEAAASAFGGIDVWVNNAGTSMWGPFEEIPLGSQARLIELNLLGAINGCHAVLPHLLERGRRRARCDNQRLLNQRPGADALRGELQREQVRPRGLHRSLALRALRAPRHPGLRRLPGLRRHAHLPRIGELHGPDPQAVPPVVPPERVAERIVRLALRPRRSARVGVANALASMPFALAPDATGRLVGRLAERFLLRSGPPAATTDGGLWETVPVRDAVVRGGWGIPERARARRAAAVAVSFAGLAGATAVLLSRVRRS